MEVVAAIDEPGGAQAPQLRSSKSTGDCGLCSCSSGAATEGAGPLTAGAGIRSAFSFVSDLSARCAQAKQHTNRQLRKLLSLPEMRADEGLGLGEEQRQALLALRTLAVTFIDHEDPATAGLMCQQLMRSAQELRLPLTGVGDDGINLSTRFVLALTPCARLLPVQQHLLAADPAEPVEEEEDAAGEGGGGEGGDAENEGEAVLQRFYQRWQQSGAAWSSRIQRRDLHMAPPLVAHSRSLPADSAPGTPGGGAPPPRSPSDQLGALVSVRSLASSAPGRLDSPDRPVSLPPTPRGTPKLPRVRRGSSATAEAVKQA